MSYCTTFIFSIPKNTPAYREKNNHPENLKTLKSIKKIAIQNLVNLESSQQIHSSNSLKRKSVQKFLPSQKRQKIEDFISDECDITVDETDISLDESDAHDSVPRRQWRKQPNQYWTSEQDQVLLDAIKSYEKIDKISWGEVAKKVKVVRPDVKTNACRKRYMLTLNPSINKDPWTMEEYKKLLELVDGCREKVLWAQVAEKLATNRTNQMCRQIYQSLTEGTLKSVGDTILNTPK